MKFKFLLYGLTLVTVFYGHGQNEKGIVSSAINFNLKKDVLLVNYDCKTDVDDLHSIAAFATLLSKPEYAALNYHAVAGTYGMQNGLYVPPNELLDLAFGENWSDAHNAYEKALQKVSTLCAEVLKQNGTIWVAEAGQSDFSADLTKKLAQLFPELDNNSIYIVQHSEWNEEVTTPEKLSYLKANTTYHKIPDGNAKGNGTAGFRSPKTIDWKSTAQKRELTPVWRLAIQLGHQYNGQENRYLNTAIEKGGLDFSDFSEVCWILGLNEVTDAHSFFDFVDSDD